MQLKAEQLTSHLAKTLAPVYTVGGDEPLLVNEAGDAIRAAARARGHSERVVLEVDPGFDWSELAAVTHSMSLFAESRLIELRLKSASPGDSGAKALTAYAEAADPENLLLVTLGRLDARTRRSKWYRALDQAGVTIAIWPVAAADLPNWIDRRMRGQGLVPTGAACAELAQRVEGNLLACAQEIEKLRLLLGPGNVDVDDILSAAADNARFDTFDLVDYTLAGNASRSLRVLRGLRDEGVEPALVTGTIAWQVRSLAGMASKVSGGASLEGLLRSEPVWARRRAGVRAALGRHPAPGWYEMLIALEQVDRTIKGLSAGDPWGELERVCLSICGIGLHPRSAK